MKMKPILLTIFALCCLMPALAQNKLRNDSLMNRELTLEKEYNPTIQDAVKMSQLPELREPQAPKSNVEFSNYTTTYEVQSKIFPLNPQAYLTNLNYSKYKGYLTGGVSNLIDIDGDLGYQILNSNNDRLNIFFSHRSSGCNVSYLQDELLENDTRKFKINDNWGGLNYLHDSGHFQFFADAKYTNSAFNYYGLSIPYFDYFPGLFTQNTNNFDKNTNQINNMFEAHLGVSSEKDSKLHYIINANYTNFRQKYGNTMDVNGSTENRFLFDVDIHQMFNTTAGLGLAGSIKMYSYSNLFKILNDSTTNYWTYSLNPYFYLEEHDLELVLGAKVEAEINGRSKIIVSPAVRINYHPNEKVLLYLLAEGGRKDNSQYNMYYENRYVDPLIRVIDSRSPVDATAGIKLIPVSTLSVEIFGGYKITNDEHFYYSNVGAKNVYDDTTPMLAGNWITPVYEDANTLKFGADLKYAYQDIFELNLKGTYYQWNISQGEYAILYEAWNKPNFETNLSVSYRLPILPLRFDLSYLGAYGRKAANNFTLSESVKMNDIHDLSLKGTYSLTSNFSIYASLNNLLFSKYDLWWGYPAQNFNIMGGLSVLF